MAKILAIDDEPDILALIKNSLRKDGHIVATVEGTDEVEFSTLADFDLILLDVMMPETDGFLFCQKIRSMIDCPILFVTAKSLEMDIMYGLGLGADDYITKPFSPEELSLRIKRLLLKSKS